MSRKTLFGGWSELCCESSFQLKRGATPIATIKHLTPKDCGGALKAVCTDSDNFEINFDANTPPMDKANAVAASLLIDFMFFEIDQGLCHCENNTLYCTCFLCYCIGCLLPCNCCVSFQNQGGGSPTSAETAVGAPHAADADDYARSREQLLPIQKEHMHRD